MSIYRYGMRSRGFSPMCQPMDGFVGREDDPAGKYHDILTYNRKLLNGELSDYELDYLGEPGKELKPCPFCGGNAEMNHGDEHGVWWVDCSDCGAETVGHSTEEEAAYAWNRRI